MRPHRLVIEGFGPFRDRQTVDFDAVSHDGLFLISGPTGAGKTSILDALCFALFNTVPGPRGSASDLRSHLAAPHDPTRVELVFSAGTRRFRIERVPQHLRPRKRGSGMTTQQHTVALAERVDGEWAGISRTAQETQSFLDGILGLNAAQFTKLVVLPQGDFAAFLHADPSERESILEKLFATEHFQAVERVLADRATEARRRTEQDSQRRRFAVETAAEASWEALPLPDAAPGVLDTLAFLGAAAVVADERAAVADVTARLALGQAESATDTAQSWRRRAEDREALSALRQDEAAWNDEAEGRESRRRELERARAAQALGARLTALRRAGSEAERLEAGAQRAQRSAVAALPAHARVRLEDLTDSDVAAAQAHLDSADDRLRRHVQLEERSASAGSAAVTAQKELEGAKNRLAALRTEEEGLRSRSDDLRGTYDSLEAAASSRDRLREQERLAAAVRTALAQRDAAHEQDVNTMHRAEETAHVLAATRRAMRRDSAGTLAELLQTDQPCPVCGSCDHPDPAVPTDGGPTSDDEAREEAADAAARSARAAARASLAAAESTLERTRAEAEGIDEDALASRLAAAEEAAAERTRLKTRLDSATAELRALRPRLEEAQGLLTTAEATSSRAATAHAEARSRLEEVAVADTTAVPASWQRFGIDAPADLRAAARTRKELEGFARARTAWATARQEADAARRDARVRGEELSAALRDSPFADVGALETAAALPLDRLEAQVEEQRAHASRLALRRESDLIRRALADPAQDAELAESSARTAARAEDAQARSDAASQRSAVVRAAAARAHEAHQQAASDRAQNEAQVAELLRDIDLAELVLGTSSDAASRMSLSSFALASLFEDVAAHASDRLVDMTAGRYRLAHDLERRRGERRSGLGLKIIDTFTEESRDPRTLSGGEGFMASLALALGMADTVRGAAGGIDLDALFLDEGFGTLDPDALSDVLAVLDRLRTGGRTIGIISHVAELQQAITTRIMVEPSPTGASVRLESPHEGSDE
ncbi:AAA family ATPase [Brevibacterium jeotgali]|uniref:Nuclease SbcCD subunit C n=1 Tax=Brevibacterium jeotgali TaxID=1262550 RepID=A0A2H1L1Q6_9MICO|nr:SMC family ATPase [Brevibacterium jeotgali]TWC02806.1 exonuclease SbcC [Brevibacterium jeotgali]SMY10828.1 exonuclease SbcC [Brevibacterium jeotgali]